MAEDTEVYERGVAVVTGGQNGGEEEEMRTATSIRFVALSLSCGALTFGACAPTAPDPAISRSIHVRPLAATLTVGDSLRVEVRGADSTEAGSAESDLLWSSSDPDVASVTGGLVRAHAVGSAAIRVETGTAMDTVSILVVTLDQRGPMGPLAVDPTNPRYFDGPDGRPVYLSGFHTWSNLQSSGPDDVDYISYLAQLRELGQDFIRLWTWEHTPFGLCEESNEAWSPLPYARTGPGRALDGKPKFDVRRFDRRFFDRLHARVQAARARGLYVSVMLFQGWSTRKWICRRGDGNPWRGHPFNAANNVNGIDGDPDGSGDGLEIHTLAIPAVVDLQKAYVRRVVEAVGDFDNVLFEVCNECGGTTVAPETTFAWETAIVDYVRRYERKRGGLRHPVGITAFAGPGRSVNALLRTSDADWVSPKHLSRRYADPDDPYASDPPPAEAGPVSVVDSDHIGVQNTSDPAFGRAWVWKSFLRGHNVIQMEGTADPPPPVAQAIRRALGQVAGLAAHLDLARMTPRGDLTSTGYALADPGESYLVYQPGSRPFTLDLSAASGTMRVEWIDPATGDHRPGIEVAGGAVRTFDPPVEGSVVVVVGR